MIFYEKETEKIELVARPGFELLSFEILSETLTKVLPDEGVSEGPWPFGAGGPSAETAPFGSTTAMTMQTPKLLASNLLLWSNTSAAAFSIQI